METNFRLWLCWGFPLCFWWAPAVLLFSPFRWSWTNLFIVDVAFGKRACIVPKVHKFTNCVASEMATLFYCFLEKSALSELRGFSKRKFDQMQPGCWTQRWKSIWGGSVSCPCRFSVIVWVLGYHIDPTDFELFASFVFCLLTMIFVPLNLQKILQKGFKLTLKCSLVQVFGSSWVCLNPTCMWLLIQPINFEDFLDGFFVGCTKASLSICTNIFYFRLHLMPRQPLEQKVF